jgi:hypothetical protein
MKKIGCLVAIFFTLATNAHGQWTQAASPNYSVSGFAGSSPLLLAQLESGLSLSTNNGMSWVTIAGPESYLGGPIAVAGNNLFAVNNHGAIFRSDNNGASWTDVSSGLRGTIYYNEAIISVGNDLFAVTDSGVFIFSSGNDQWSLAETGLPAPVPGGYFVSEGSTVFFTDNTVAYITQNHGASWTKLPAYPGGSLLSTSSTLLALSQSGAYRSQDFGSSWKKMNDSVISHDQIIANGSVLFAESGLYNGMVYRSTNFGSNWDTIGTMHRTSAIIISGPNLVVGSSNTGIWFAPLSSFTNGVSIKERTSDISVVPNPATGIIKINNLPDDLESISIVNVLGEPVMEIANPHQSDVTLDMSKLSSGVYYARIVASSSTKTMMIVRE